MPGDHVGAGDRIAAAAGATVAETAASHSLYVSQPQAVVDIIKQAAETTA